MSILLVLMLAQRSAAQAAAAKKTEREIADKRDTRARKKAHNNQS
jgi:hypothetical protein